MIGPRFVTIGGLLGVAGGVAVLTGESLVVPGGALVGQVPVPANFPPDRFLAHWWVFPASVLFSLVALASGVSGALFFSPFFMLVVGLSPSQAIGVGLLTEVFGMGNGPLNYLRQGVVDYATAKWLLLGAVPSVVVGAFATHPYRRGC